MEFELIKIDTQVELDSYRIHREENWQFLSGFGVVANKDSVCLTMCVKLGFGDSAFQFFQPGGGIFFYALGSEYNVMRDAILKGYSLLVTKIKE